ncbi:MAG: pseudouridine synthase [Pseudohongiella sp.]|nr:pseudouridine synthase [Pseudohongiella sp.]MDO9521075.1 pseudouridine synthase [Pseudohongiella sp.]
MRLDKYISHATEYSRAQVKKLLRDKRVSIGTAPETATLIKKADHEVSEQDVVLLDGVVIEIPSTSYLMLHKPAGYVCANTDSENPTVLDLIGNAPADLSIAGRLDKDTTGLVLLSNDGKWVHRIISPRRECPKIYHAELDQPINDEVIKQFASGFFLKGDIKETKPAVLEVLAGNTVSVMISEGRYHQVKRMFAACGFHVVALHRVSIAGITLDADLEPGQYRTLTDAEVNSIGLQENV